MFNKDNNSLHLLSLLLRMYIIIYIYTTISIAQGSQNRPKQNSHINFENILKRKHDL